MTHEQQRSAIAKWCGWRYADSREIAFGATQPLKKWHDPEGCFNPPPDYPNDLNAMHKAEGLLGEKRGAYEAWLQSICRSLRNSICATAAQRAEALLRTIGKWHE